MTNSKSAKKSIFFVSSNKERVLPDEIGKDLLKEFNLDYFAVYPEMFDIEPEQTNTYQLLKNQKVKVFITENSNNEQPLIVVFKNSTLIQNYCSTEGYKLLAPDARISEDLENKIIQSEFFANYKIPCPDSVWGKFESFDFYKLATKFNLPFILQFGRGNSGGGTHLIEDKETFDVLFEDYPERDIRCTKFIQGETVTINICLYKNQPVLGAPSLQMTGVRELTPSKLSTVGNDWAYAKEFLLTKKLEKKLINLIEKVSVSLATVGYQGIFGLDIVWDKDDLKTPFKIIEINSRFPASTRDETEMAVRHNNPIIFLYHLAQFLPEIKLPQIDLKAQKLCYYNRARLLLRSQEDNKELKRVFFEEAVYEGGGKIKEKALEMVLN